MLDVIEDFLSCKSVFTKLTYKSTLNMFFDFCKQKYKLGQEEAIKTATAERILAFAADLRKRKARDGTTFSDVTVYNKLAGLSSVFAFLVEMEQLDKNVVDKARRVIRLKKSQKRPARAVEYEKVMPIVRAPASTLLMQQVRVRDCAMLAILFGGGFRRSECSNLRLGDIKRTASGKYYIELQHTKAGELQPRLLPDWAWAFVLELVEQRKSEGADETMALFVRYSSRGKPGQTPLSTAQLYNSFKLYCKLCGVKAAPHWARATFVTKAKAEGFEDRLVATAIGHKGNEMVRTYDKRGNLSDLVVSKMKY